jgi:Flp pilus assembly protein TadB
MSVPLIIELILLYSLWRTGLLRRGINALNIVLIRQANDPKPSPRQGAALRLVRAAEYLELTRGSRFTPGAVWIGYGIGGILAATLLAANESPVEFLRLFIAYVLLIGLIGIVLAILMGGSMYVTAAQKNMARMLPEALGIMGNEIAAGHSVEAAVQRVAMQFGKPLSQEFTDALIKMTASGGLIPIDVALAEIAQNPLYQSDPLDQAALTISVVRPLGGDLGALLNDLSRLLREREATEREIRTQLAPGRQAATSLVVIILGLFGALTLFPLFNGLLYGTYAGRFVLILASIGIGIAVFWIIQINSYEV